ncbi:hypothetical protein PMAYCL1PPCAC_17310, partial [Pristionchus mayeri]
SLLPYPLQRSLATLPLEILVDIVSFLPYDDRVSCRSVCRPLNHAEFHQKSLLLPEIAVYRTSPSELTLFAETNSQNNGEPFLSCRSQQGKVLNAWRRLGCKNRDIELTTISHHHLWCWEEAPLGRVGGAIHDLLNNAHVEVLKLNQLTLTNEVNDSLRFSLIGSSIDSIFATINYKLDENEYFDWLTEVPSKGLTVYTRSLFSSSFPFSESFLLKAAQLPRVILHAKSDRGSSAISSPIVTDSLLLSLLSSTCICLRLLFNCSSLSAEGILEAIELLRSLPGTRGLTLYTRSEVVDDLMDLIGDDSGRGNGHRRGNIDKQREQLVVKDLWMEKDYREIRYLHSDTSDKQIIDDSENSFFKPISK